MARILPFSPVAAPAPEAPPDARRAASRRHRWCESGAIDPGQLAEALDQQRQQDQRLGTDSGRRRADLRRGPRRRRCRSSRGSAASTSHDARPTRTWSPRIDPYRCLELEAVPWRQIGGTRVIAIAARQRRGGDGGLRRRRRGARAGARRRRTTIRRAITDAFAGAAARRRARPLPGGLQLPRPGPQRLRRRRGRAAAVAGARGGGALPLLALQLLMGWIVLANALTMGLRLVALFARLRARAGEAARTTRRGWPTTGSCRGSRSWCRSARGGGGAAAARGAGGDGLSRAAARHQAGARGGRRGDARGDRARRPAADHRGGDRPDRRA